MMKSTIKGSTRTVDKRFKFDHIFDSSASQEDVFRGVRMPQMLEGVLDGYHATVFAYGQTGSGKTFTMEGYQYEVRGSIVHWVLLACLTQWHVWCCRRRNKGKTAHTPNGRSRLPT